MTNTDQMIEYIDYFGFELPTQEVVLEINSGVGISRKMDFDEQSFLMVTQKHWEDDIMWDTASTSDSLIEKDITTSRKSISPCWVPTRSSRSLQNSSKNLPSTGSTSTSYSSAAVDSLLLATYNFTSEVRTENGNNNEQSDNLQSMLPIENPDLVYGCWENNIIWDAKDVDLSEELIPCYDIDDENVVLIFPPDGPLSDSKSKRVKPNCHSSTTKKVLSASGLVKSYEYDSDNYENVTTVDKDPFNISNDHHYFKEKYQQPFCTISLPTMTFHCKPVQTFHPTLFPTSQFQFYGLRAYHRRSVRPYLSALKYYTLSKVKNFVNLTKKKREQRILEAKKPKTVKGKQVYVSTSEFETIPDLSGRVDEIILIEYCEQFPPLLSQVGMCSRIKNYTHRRNRHSIDLKYGEMDVVRESTFLGELGENDVLQTLENNMYRCPIYEHPVGLDFLVIIAGDNLFVREFDALFTAGQQCPLTVVYPPKSKMAVHYAKQFLKVEICRLLHRSKTKPKTILTSSIKESFPNLPEHSIRKVLKDMAEYQRMHFENIWEMKAEPEFKLPTESELSGMFTPEQYCAHYSSASAELRLKLASYKETNFLPKPKSSSNENNDEEETEVMEEVKSAPWNTTKAFVSAARGKCLLEVKGPADPTGCGEGFSYVRIPSKPFPIPNCDKKKLIKGTKSDLRKLGIGEAKKILANFGIPQDQIKKLSRWEIIDIVRTLSTEKETEGKGKELDFSRYNPNSVVEYQKKNKDDLQSVFELQNRILSSSEILSSDEEDDDNQSEFDVEEAAKFLEDIVVDDKTVDQIDEDLEENERKKLIHMMMVDKADNSLNEKREGEKRRILKIHRTYNNPDGTTRTETEIVDTQEVIDIYVKIQRNGDNAKPILRKGILKIGADRLKASKKRLEQERARRSYIQKSKAIVRKNKPKHKLLPGFTKKCGACGMMGHLKTNSYCPKYRAPRATSRNVIKGGRTSSRKRKPTKRAYF